MRIVSLLLFILLLSVSCDNGTSSILAESRRDSLSTAPNDSVIPEDTEDTEFAIFYTVIADTASDYYTLMRKMHALQKAVPLGIDTLNRYFDKKKKKIVVSENDEDEMYRGEYYPRRFASTSWSIDYLSTFDSLAPLEKTMALVAAVCETESCADSVLKAIKTKEPRSYRMVSRMYTGCMH